MERIDDLLRDGLKIIQDPDQFCFGIDAVLLSDFAKVRSGDKVLDLCAGSGIVSLLMLARYKGASYSLLEIQPHQADMARRTMELNHLEDKVTVMEGDLKDIKAFVAAGSMDAVTVNPPYMKGQGLTNESEALRIARHETLCTLEDVVAAAAYALKYHGKLYMVHRPERLADIFTEMRKYHLEPKSMRLVAPYKETEPTQVLVMAVKGGSPSLKVFPTLTTYESPGVYTEEVIAIYGDGHKRS